VAGVEKFERDARTELARRVQVQRFEQLHQRIHVFFVVQRLEKVLAVATALLVHIFEVALLEKARIAQKYAAKLARRLPCEDPAPETLLYELREVAGVVYVRVGEYHVIDLSGIDRQIAVFLERFLAVALIKAAIEKNPLSTGFNKVHGTGRCTSGSKKCDFHILFLPVYDFILVGNYTISIFFIRNGDNQWD
jgi:hypothetical protein